MGKQLAALCAVAVLFTFSVAYAQEKKEESEQKESVAVTVYNSNIGVVKENRFIELKKGTNTVSFRNVAAQIDGTSVHFKSLTDPDNTTVLEQNFEYDLVSADKLLQKFIDKKITVVTEDNQSFAGTLLSFDAWQIVLSVDPQKGPIQMLTRQNNIRNIQFPELPTGLITKPTLVWLVEAEKEGKHLSNVTYITNGINWNADYTLILSPDEKKVDLSGWVTIYNRSGASYENASLKLVAGDIGRPKALETISAINAYGMEDSKKAPAFEERKFFEYHLYALERPTDLKDNSTKQIELLNAGNISIAKVYKYDGAKLPRYPQYSYEDPRYGTESTKKVNVYIEFKNSKENNLGMPLPKGRIRVYKPDEKDKSLELAGEDSIDHTPKDETVKIYVGDAFDIVGERKQTDFKLDTRAHWAEESFEIRVRNHKTEPVEVEVIERLYRWLQWEIRKSSDQYEKIDSRTIRFKVKIEPDKEAVVTYTVYYTW